MGRTRIKICGIRDAEAAAASIEAGADSLGFVFVPNSTRYIKPEEAWEIVNALPPMVTSVGVFVNASVDTFCDIEEQCPTNYAQLAGSEPERVVRDCGPGVIKTVRYAADTIAGDLARWDAVDEVDAILIDAPTDFEWGELAGPLEEIATPIILAGALTAENVGAAVRALRPYGVNVSDGVERERGVKDAALMEAFCEAVRAADGGDGGRA
jgi:phosphoribosylanthranilate isomerase